MVLLDDASAPNESEPVPLPHGLLFTDVLVALLVVLFLVDALKLNTGAALVAVAAVPLPNENCGFGNTLLLPGVVLVGAPNTNDGLTPVDVLAAVLVVAEGVVFVVVLDFIDTFGLVDFVFNPPPKLNAI